MGGPLGPSANEKVGITKLTCALLPQHPVAKASKLSAEIASGSPKRTSFETALNLPTIGGFMAQRCCEYTGIRPFRQKWPKCAA